MKRLISILAVMAVCLSAGAQAKSSSGFGLDPSDDAAVARMRARSDSIRQHRPVVALVLSGGGAKGAATIGAMKYMEKYKLPIDMILGTSVGGLLGGFYALGYSPDYLTELIRGMDWDLVLSDRVDTRFVPKRMREYNEKFALSFPFYYRRDTDFNDALDHIADFSEGKLNVSSSAVENATTKLTDNLRSSLPSGLAYGQNINQVFSSRTVGYSDSTDFLSFPIPFACVSTDLVSGKAKVWHSGSINFAMRSTMSIPALFVPARRDNLVMLDGGMRNNFPVDIAKDLGADIVIGIDLTTDDPNMTADKVSNIADVVMRAIDMFSNDSYERSIAALDLHIKPDLTGYNMLSFSSDAVEFMLLRGYHAAENLSDKLDSLRRVIGPEEFEMKGRKAVDVGERSVLIDGIEIAGVGEKDAEYIRSRLYIKDSSFVNARVLEDEVARIFGGGSFDFVNYELLGTEEPYRLKIHGQKGPVHRFGVGFRLDTEEIIAALLNLGLNTNALQGSSLDLTARISANPYAGMHFRYVPAKGPTFNAKAIARLTDRNSVLYGDNYFNVSFYDIKEELSLSDIRFLDGEFSAGIYNDYHKIRRIMGTTVIGDYDPASDPLSFQGAFAGLRMNTTDSGYFPEYGVNMGIRSDVVSSLIRDGGKSTFGILDADFLAPLSVGRFAAIPKARVRFLFGDQIPLFYANLIGGDIAGRYAEQQIPFVGINNATFRRNYLGIGGLDLRYRIGNSYITLSGNASYDFFNFRQIKYGELNWGLGASYAYNTPVGPIKFLMHYSSITKGLGAYLSIGFNF
jgi:NTE family protein